MRARGRVHAPAIAARRAAPLTATSVGGNLAGMPRRLLLPMLLVSVALACGKDEDSTDGATGGATEGASSTSGTPMTDGATGVVTTGDATDGTGGQTGGATTGAGDTTGQGSTTGVDVSGFERFTMNIAAGPCPPEADCDGFIEVMASGLLRVETFGEVGDPVSEAALSPEDLAAALQVFADPALLALLDGPDPACEPPTDIFESMTVVVDAVSHDTTTTFCDQPPIAAARDMAIALSEKYVAP